MTSLSSQVNMMIARQHLSKRLSGMLYVQFTGLSKRPRVAKRKAVQTCVVSFKALCRSMTPSRLISPSVVSCKIHQRLVHYLL